MQPLKAGDMAEVIMGLGRGKSPNIGLTVKVLSLQGEHSQYGRVWRCEGPGVQQLTDAGTYAGIGWADFPAAWLRKIEPDNGPKTETTDRELSV